MAHPQRERFQREAPAIWLGNGVTLALAGFILAVK
jgi:hypothetical protein